MSEVSEIKPYGKVKFYHIKATNLVPNSPQPLLHYPGFFTSKPTVPLIPLSVYDLFLQNGWETQWVFRYGPTQDAHYHSGVHECMAVLSGTATIRFGTSDLEAREDTSENKQDLLEIQANEGDIFIIPAGVSHKTMVASTSQTLKLLTPGDGHSTAAGDIRKALSEIQLDGFTMMGAYPKGGGAWDFSRGGEHVGEFESVWDVQKPEMDPVLGSSSEGILGRWEERG